MKAILIAGISFFLFSTAFAQSDKYMNAMKANVAAIDTAFKNPQSLLTLASSFERIAEKEKSQWLPYYWAAFCQVNYTYLVEDKSKTDPIADKAEQLLNKADSLQPDNSEISCVYSMIASARMLVDPMTRYMQYGMKSGTYLEKAISQNPDNPRPYYLRGQGLRYTPEQFGGGCKPALEDLNTAAEKFKTFKPASDIDPNWGEARTTMLINECSK